MADMDTKRTQQPGSGPPPQDHHEEPGLVAWVSRNRWLVMRLFMVILFTYSASLVADQFAYMLEGKPTELSVEQINAGRLPPGVGVGDYVRITGTPDVGENVKPANVGGPESKIGVSSRYSVSYFYFRMKETGDNFLVQSAQTLPSSSLQDLESSGKRTWDGRLSNVGTVIFHDTTNQGLTQAGLPTREAIPVVETGDTPGKYKDLFPAYSAVLGFWLVSLAWFLWKRNKPFLGI